MISNQSLRFLKSRYEAVAVTVAVILSVLGAVAAPYLPFLLVLVGIYLITLYRVFHKPQLAFYLYLLVLPFANILFIVLYHMLGTPLSIAKLLLYWEEGTLIVALSGVATQLFVHFKTRIKFTVVDTIMLGYVVLICVYMALVGSVFPRVGGGDLIRALRDNLFFVFAYMLGRVITTDQQRFQSMLYRTFLIAAIVSVIGVAERFLTSIQFYIDLGLPHFYADVVNYPSSAETYGLPVNFFYTSGGQLQRRLVSVYFSSVSFAVPFTLFIPVVLMYMFQKKFGLGDAAPKRPFVWLLLFLFAVVLSVTRASIAIAFAQIGLTLVLLSSRFWAFNRLLLFIISSSVLVGVMLFVTNVGNVQTLVLDTLSGRNPSSYAHKLSNEYALQQLRERPLGNGLGTSDIRSTTNTEVSAGEGQYAHFIGEFGILGVALYGAMLVTLCLTAWRIYRRAPHASSRGLGFAMFLTLSALLPYGVISEWHLATWSFTVPFWWLCGVLVQHSTHAKLQTRTTN